MRAVLDRLVGVADAWRGRLADRRLDVGVGAVVVVVAALVAGVVWYRIGVAGAGAGAGVGPPPSPSVDRTGAARRPVPTAAPAVTTVPVAGVRPTPRRGADLVVHVAGAVHAPGVVALPNGSRVVDALARAGGARTDADLDRLNLAARVLDGQRILVPVMGAPTAPDAGGSAAADAVPIDLNAATVAQLDTLPGIGPTLAGAIVAERERRGGFRSVDELGEVHGIGPARLADLRARVTV